MKCRMTFWMAAIMVMLATAAARGQEPAVRFAWVDAYVDSGGKRLAAYQFEFLLPGDAVTIVGIEGGEHAAFQTPPYYDARALSHNRVILAAFSTQTDLPTGKTRVARIHVRVQGERGGAYTAKLITAATADGTVIPVTLTLSEGAAP
jgi:hypothetical protein